MISVVFNYPKALKLSLKVFVKFSSQWCSMGEGEGIREYVFCTFLDPLQHKLFNLVI